MSAVSPRTLAQAQGKLATDRRHLRRRSGLALKTFLAARFIFGLTHHLLQRVWISDVRRVKVFKFGRGYAVF